LSIPFDKTMAELDSSFSEIAFLMREINALKVMLLDLNPRLRKATSTSFNIKQYPCDSYMGSAADYLHTLNELFAKNVGYSASVNAYDRIREVLDQSETQYLLGEFIAARYAMARKLIDLEISTLDAVNSIRDYKPNIILPIGHIGIVGSATFKGWKKSVKMRHNRKDPNVWQLRIKLSNGALKFRADDDWATNWGVRASRDNLAEICSFEFEGDASTAFPYGVAELNGINIPVEAGTYDVTFNTQTFEYSFERVED
jgi:hypothetical protein